MLATKNLQLINAIERNAIHSRLPFTMEKKPQLLKSSAECRSNPNKSHLEKKLEDSYFSNAFSRESDFERGDLRFQIASPFEY
ncbi:hypothetical protein CEXT_813341 [Caerostris extrusa]|uniref:Uncharacterized protein n=1 Tax=Caerostris extrusa TaxID=172846 RepID=A0AAV4MAB1_CAEEX|nr:hypothetical protein CEXT_813341 [Caerostris extrusa]